MSMSTSLMFKHSRHWKKNFTTSFLFLTGEYCDFFKNLLVKIKINDYFKESYSILYVNIKSIV